MNLRDRVVVVTGASSGFGEAIARRCAAAGARVVLAARSEGKLAALAGELGVDRALAVPCDLTRDADVARLARATADRFGWADVLVNNAGYGLFAPLADAPLSDLQGMIDTNLYGAVRCTQAFLPEMLARRSGQIVVVASLAGLIAAQNMGYYTTTKFALVGWARTLALELAGSGVRCALLCPGPSPTGFQRNAPRESYPRSINILPWIDADAVARATVRAIRRRTNGEIVLPWQAHVLARLANLSPLLTRLVLRFVR